MLFYVRSRITFGELLGELSKIVEATSALVRFFSLLLEVGLFLFKIILWKLFAILNSTYNDNSFVVLIMTDEKYAYVLVCVVTSRY